MKAYIGTKIILAEPMLDFEFNEKFKGIPRVPETPFRQGYHVQYSNPNGSTYDSWSPKLVFEHAYREVSEDERAMICQESAE